MHIRFKNYVFIIFPSFYAVILLFSVSFKNPFTTLVGTRYPNQMENITSKKLKFSHFMAITALWNQKFLYLEAILHIVSKYPYSYRFLLTLDWTSLRYTKKGLWSMLRICRSGHIKTRINWKKKWFEVQNLNINQISSLSLYVLLKFNSDWFILKIYFFRIFIYLYILRLLNRISSLS